MKKLINLEFKRIGLKKQLIALTIVNICITLLTFMMVTLNAFGNAEVTNPGYFTVSSIDILVKAFFIVWEAVLITQIIIEEFKNQTLIILYSYPVNRKDLLKAKLFIIISIIFTFIVISLFVQNVTFAILSNVIGYVHYKIDIFTIINIFATTIGAIFCGLIPFGIGMINRSIAATIISSIVIVSLTVSTQGNDQNLMAMWGVSGCLGIIGIIVTLVTVNNVISNDLQL